MRIRRARNIDRALVKTFLWGTLLYFCSMSIQPVLAKSIYIDTILNNSCTSSYNPEARSCGNGGAMAYNSLDQGLGQAVPGDTVLLRAGSYGQLNPPASGLPSQPITIKNYNGEAAAIKNIGAVAIWILKRSYLVIDGLQVENVTGFSRLEDSSNITIRNTVFSNAQASGTTGAVKLVRSYMNRIENCTFSDGSDIMVLQDNSNNNLILNNSFDTASHSLISVRCSNYNVIRGNTFSNPDQKAVEIYDCEGTSDAPVRYDATKGNLIEANFFIRTAASDADHRYNAIQHGAQETIVRFNIFRDCLGGGVNYQSYSNESIYVHNNRMYNNTFYDNRCYGIVGDSGDKSKFYDNRVTNNLLYKNSGCSGTGGQVRITDSSEVILSNNALASGDPGFADENSFNFKLKSGSPYIDKGVFITTTVGSGSGTSMPVQDATSFYDGYGIAGESGDYIQLQGQTKRARIVGIDHSTGLLSLDQSLTWQAGQGIHLAYEGSAPDMGALEYGSENEISAPKNLRIVQ